MNDQTAAQKITTHLLTMTGKTFNVFGRCTSNISLDNTPITATGWQQISIPSEGTNSSCVPRKSRDFLCSSHIPNLYKSFIGADSHQITLKRRITCCLKDEIERNTWLKEYCNHCGENHRYLNEKTRPVTPHRNYLLSRTWISFVTVLHAYSDYSINGLFMTTHSIRPGYRGHCVWLLRKIAQSNNLTSAGTPEINARPQAHAKHVLGWPINEVEIEVVL